MMRVAVWTWVAETQVMEALAGVPGVDALLVRSREELLDAIDDVDGVVMLGGAHSYTAEVSDRLRASPRVKWLQLVSAGYEGVEAHGLSEHVLLTGTGEGISAAVAEHALALLFALARGLSPATRQQAQKRWDRSFTPRMITLAGRTLVVMGLGTIGRKIAHHARALGMRVIGISQSGSPVEGPDEVRRTTELHAVLPEAHALILALPLRQSTRHILDAAALARCRDGAFIVNVGRGELIDQDALLAALHSGRVGGAGLDVTDPEPLPPEHPLWWAPNVIVTPHVGGAGDPLALKQICTDVAENARRLLAGLPPINRIDLPRS